MLICFPGLEIQFEALTWLSSSGFIASSLLLSLIVNPTSYFLLNVRGLLSLFSLLDQTSYGTATSLRV